MKKVLAAWQRLYKEHRVIWLGVFLALMIAVGLVAAWIPKASAQICTHNPDGTCAVTPAQASRLFRAGHYDKAHGMQLRKTFRSPRAARHVIIGKAVRYYKHQPAGKRARMRNRYNVGTARGLGGSCIGWDVAQCVAHRMWHSLTTNADCSSFSSWPSRSSSVCTTWSQEQQGITKDRVQKGGQIAFCAGNATLMVRGAAESPTGPTALAAAGFGTAGCLWAAWSLFD